MRRSEGSGGLRRLVGRWAETTRSVRVRILAWVLALSALGMAGAAGAAYVLVSEQIDQRIDRSLQQEVQEFVEFQRGGIDPLSGRPFTSVDRLMDVSVRRNVPDEHQTIMAFLPDRTYRPRQVLSLHSDPAFRRAATRSATPTYGTFYAGGEPIRYAAMPVSQSGRRGTFVVAYYTQSEHEEFADVLRTYAMVALAALGLVGLVAWLSMGRLLRPIQHVRRTALAISDTDLTRRIEVTGRDDVSELGRAFNAMLDRLDEAFAAQREFLDDAGHELRTPITIVRGHLELLDVADPRDAAETRELVLDELGRMSRMVEELILLAQARRPDFLQLGTVEIGALTDEVFDKARALGERAWRIDERAEVSVLADPQRLTQALLQLAQNAVKFTRAGDLVAIGSASYPEEVLLWVRDAGPGVAPGLRQRIFERFEQGPRPPLTDEAPQIDSSGLGLAIVRAIAAAHGGDAWVESPPGTGATFVLRIPRPVQQAAP